MDKRRQGLVALFLMAIFIALACGTATTAMLEVPLETIAAMTWSAMQTSAYLSATATDTPAPATDTPTPTNTPPSKASLGMVK